MLRFAFWVLQLLVFVGYICANLPWWVALPSVTIAMYYAIYMVTGPFQDDASSPVNNGERLQLTDFLEAVDRRFTAFEVRFDDKIDKALTRISSLETTKAITAAVDEERAKGLAQAVMTAQNRLNYRDVLVRHAFNFVMAIIAIIAIC